MIWVAHDIRDEVVDFVRYWSELTEVPVCRFLKWIELSPRKFGRWLQRFGKVNEHNGNGTARSPDASSPPADTRRKRR